MPKETNKQVVSLSLSPHLIALLKETAEADDISVSGAASMLLEANIETIRAKKKTLSNVSVYETLPSTLFDVRLNHPIFQHGRTGKGPFQVNISHRRI